MIGIRLSKLTVSEDSLVSIGAGSRRKRDRIGTTVAVATDGNFSASPGNEKKILAFSHGTLYILYRGGMENRHVS